jgi:hypothetical protein
MVADQMSWSLDLAHLGPYLHIEETGERRGLDDFDTNGEVVL